MSKKAGVQLSITPDDQWDSDEANIMSGVNQIWQSQTNDTPNSHTLTPAVTNEKSSISNVDAAAHKVDNSSIVKKVEFIFVDGCQILSWLLTARFF